MNEMNTKLSQDQKKELNLPFTMEEMCKAVSTWNRKTPGCDGLLAE